MKLNVSKKDFKDAFMEMVIYSVMLAVLYCGILLTPNEIGMHHEWQENQLETTTEYWPIFLGGIVAISFFCSMLGLVKKIKRKT